MATPVKSWLDDPTQLDSSIEQCRSESSSDRMMSRFLLQLRYARPTNVSPSAGLTSASPAFLDGFLSVVKQIGYNQMLEVTDACTAKICQPLRPRVIPVAAKPDIARLCTLLNRLIDGVLDACAFPTEATSAWEDSYCVPNGFVLFEIEPQTQEIRCHRVEAPEECVHWHRAEGRDPIHLYIQEPVSRAVLLERYPHAEAEIKKAPTWKPQHVLGVDPPSAGDPDTVCLNRGWRRRMGDEPGRYVVTCNRAVLNGEPENGVRKGEEWEFDFFPVAVARNRWDYKGWAGVPMGRYIAPHHYAINRLARIAEDSFKAAVPIIWSHKGSKLNNISDIPYQVGKWEGMTKPSVEPTNPVSEQVLKRIDYHDAKAYAIAGINKSIAQGQAPNGVVAAVAMREIVALADARANEYQKHWETMWRQAGHIVVAFAKKLKKVRIKSTDANAELMEEIDPRSIKLDRNDYRISYGISSALSKTITGLMSDLNEFKDLGFIDAVDMAQAIGDKVPDLQAVFDNVTASKRLAAKMVQDALERGQIPVTPSPMQNLDDIIILGKQAWCRAQLTPDRYPPENREVLRKLMRLAAARKGQPAPQAQAATVAPGTAVAPGAMLTAGVPQAPQLPAVPQPQ